MVVLVFLVAVPAVLAYSSGPPAGHTGAPGENTCRECHTSFGLNQSPGTLSIDGVPSTYEPGREYTLTIRIAHSSRSRWGFQVGAFTDAMENGGTLTVIDATRTRKTTSGGRSYIAHVTAGTYPNQAGGASWTFKWTAPPANAGTVSFYAAGNAANNNGTSVGDNIYTAFVESLAPEVGLSFADITVASGLDSAAGGTGLAWADYDLDGDFDVFLSRTGRGLLYRNDGGRFSEVGPTVGLATATEAIAAAWGDHDNDGRPDLAMATATGVRLFHNEATSFADRTAGSGLPTSGVKAVSWADFDRDGDLDLFATGTTSTTASRNTGDGRFEPVTGTALDNVGPADAMAWADADGDGRLDLFVTSSTRGVLMLGDGAGGLSGSTSSGATAATGSGASWADYDRDGDVDLFVVGVAGVRLLRNDAGNLIDATSATGLSGVSGRGVAVGDAEGDGHVDVLVVGEQSDRLLEYDGSVFSEVSNKAGLAEIDGTAVAWVDFDSDGRLDVMQISATGVGLWENPFPSTGVAVRAITDADHDATDSTSSSDRDSLGATVHFDDGGDFASAGQQARVIDAGGSSSQAPPVAVFAAASGSSFGVRATFPDGEGREAHGSMGSVGSVRLLDPRAPTIATVAHKQKNGKDKLVVDGARFRTGTEVVEVTLVRMTTTKYPSKKQLGDGTGTRVVGTDTSFSQLVPQGVPVRVTTHDPGSGIRSAPFTFIR